MADSKGLDSSRVVRLEELASYQEGSVVSRVLMKNDAGNVTLFAFDAGEGLTEHSSPFDALVHVLDGEAEVTIGGEPHRLTGGQAILMPKDVPHGLKAVSRFRMMLVMLRPRTD